MNTEKEVQAIEQLTIKAGNAGDSADALRFSQAALNLAHLIHVRHEIEKIKG